MDATLTHIPRSIHIYEAALEGLSRINEALYKERPSLPEIHQAGVRYRRERGEAWRHAVDVVGEGWGDCEDLAAARVGWLRARGGDRGARVVIKRTGPRMTHALVRRGNGAIEDPSKDLGMGTLDGAIEMDPFNNEAIGWNPFRRKRPARPARAARGARVVRPPVTRAARAAASQPVEVPTELEPSAADEQEREDDRDIERGDEGEWEQIGADPSTSLDISWQLTRTDNGWQGIVRIPLEAGRMLLVSRTAPSKSKAESKAVSAAASVINNPAVAALIPPQAKFALNLVQSEKARSIAKKLLKLF